MSDINLDFVVSNNEINFTVQPNDLTFTPNATSINFYTSGAPTPGGSLGELQFNSGILDGVPFTNYNGNKLTLGSTSNLIITGGVNGYFLQTDGTGNLNWAAAGGGGNGSPGGSNTQIQFNDSGLFGGNAGFTFNKTNGDVNMPGNLTVTGNITGNIATSNFANYAGNVTVSNQPNITTVGTLTDLRVDNPNIHIGNNAGQASQGNLAVAIGYNAGYLAQGNQSVAIGPGTGYTNQGLYSVAIGTSAGNYYQGDDSISIGRLAAANSQGSGAIAIGAEAGKNNQSIFSIAIGYQSGVANQGINSIALGAYAGNSNQHSNTIVINATGANLNSQQANSTFVKPIRQAGQNKFLFYNSTTGEVTADVIGNYVGNITVVSANTVIDNAQPNITSLGILTGLSINGTTSLYETIENVSLIGAQTGTYNFDVLDGAIQYSTGNAAANLTLNFRGNSSTALNTILANSKSLTATYIMTTSTTGYNIANIQIDSVAQTIKWVNGTTPPLTGNSSTAYTFTLVRTGNSPVTYTVFGSSTRYA